jgi:23S rRNA pseudouridine2605 synthase
MKQGFNERNKAGKGGKPAVRSNSPKAETGGKRIGKSLPEKTTVTGKRVGKSVPTKAESFGKRKPAPARDSEAAVKRFNTADTKKTYGNQGTNSVRENEAGKRYKSADTKETFARPGSSPVRENEAGHHFKPTERKRTFARPGGASVRNIPKKSSATGEIRLNRFIANAGVCSRREADTFIVAGMVQINGKVVTELGTKVLPTDEVRFDGNRISAEKKIYLLLNKPKDFVTTTDDPHADKIVMDLIKDACPERIYPVGRLDRNTTGLLLFTNDGDLSKRLTHPSHQMKKIYQVSLDKPVTIEHLQEIADGIQLEDGPIAADAISYINNEEASEVGIEIHSGRNRIVRRIFEHLGYRVKKLDRVMYAGLTKKNLPRGKYRFLTEKEVGFLKMQ